MKIAAVASAFPEHYYPQSVLTAALEKTWGEHLPSAALLRRLHENAQVHGRYLALPLESYPALKTWGAANDAWIETAQKLGSDALCRAATKAGIDLREIDALFFVSVTGVASPSIDARIVNRLELNPNIRRVPIFGLGCVAGAAGISQAADYVRAYPTRVAALVSVELCTLTVQYGDLSTANLICTGLFGDGAAAAVITGARRELKADGRRRRMPAPEIIATRSTFYPDTEDAMGWKISENGFRIVLSPAVPKLIRRRLRGDVDAFLADHALTRADIGRWILHPGGPRVLEATQDALELDREALAPSWNCLRKVGNLSSASVLLVLEEVMTRRPPKPGTWSVLGAMGPGFCSELVLLRW